MKKCVSCNVNIENNLQNCPLCNAKTEAISDEYVNGYPNVKRTYVYELICKILLYFSIAGSLVCIVINNYVSRENPWSLISIVGQFYLYFSMKYILRKNRFIPIFILIQIVLIGVVVLVIDFSVGWKGWSVNFVIPFAIVGGMITLSVISIFKFRKYSEYIFYIFIIGLIGTFPLFSLIFKLSSVVWPGLLCFLYSVCTIIFMFVFLGRRFNNELKRRLHF